MSEVPHKSSTHSDSSILFVPDTLRAYSVPRVYYLPFQAIRPPSAQCSSGIPLHCSL
ncbi:hypothetical protein PISMIDRAFT_680759, partial [Pisolithus microcarpus 441]